MILTEFIEDVYQVLYSPEINEVMVSDSYFTTTFFYLDSVNYSVVSCYFADDVGYFFLLKGFFILDISGTLKE